jgi:hypothetical protein
MWCIHAQPLDRVLDVGQISVCVVFRDAEHDTYMGAYTHTSAARRVRAADSLAGHVPCALGRTSALTGVRVPSAAAPSNVPACACAVQFELLVASDVDRGASVRARLKDSEYMRACSRRDDPAPAAAGPPGDGCPGAP